MSAVRLNFIAPHRNLHIMEHALSAISPLSCYEIVHKVPANQTVTHVDKGNNGTETFRARVVMVEGCQ